MTKFTDGPAAGKTLCLGRAPIFLCVVKDKAGEVDALDQLDDVPKPDESITVYRKVSDDGTVHVDGRDKSGKRFGRWYQAATYVIHSVQPDDATARDKEAWAAWCAAQWAAIKAAKENAQ